MKIAILTELFPPSVGGQENRYAELSQVLAQLGHSVDIFCVQNIPGTQAEEVIGNLRIHRYPKAFDYQKPAIKATRRRLWPTSQYSRWCRKISADDFDFFLFNQWPLLHIAFARGTVRSKAAIDWCELRNGLIFSFIQRYFPKLVAKNIANSEKLAHSLAGLSGRCFESIPTGIFFEKYKSAPRLERSGILYLGRITEHKNLPLVLASFDALVAKGYTGRLRIAGDGPALTTIRRASAGMKAANKIDIMGAVDERSKLDLLATSDLLIITSRREGFPRVVAEAMASGLPVVTVDYPENGAKDVVLEYGIGQVTSPTAEAISEAMLRVLSDGQIYSAAGLRASKSLDWASLVPKFISISASVKTQA